MAADKGTQQQTFDNLFKILLIGDEKAGKTCLLQRFVNDSFMENYVTTIGVDFAVKMVVCAGSNVKLQIWDTAGQERFRSISQSYYRGSHAIIIVFDVTDRTSFTNIEKWLNSVSTYSAVNTVVLLVGNKTDLIDREVTQEEAQTLAEKHGLTYIETSVRDNKNVNEPFLCLTKKLLQNKGANTAWWKKTKFD